MIRRCSTPQSLTISRDRFEEIIRYLHFVDNSNLPMHGHPSFSRLQKVQPVLSLIKKSMSQAYNLHCQLSIDEAMEPFKGRSSMQQYMPIKPIKRGFKIWVIADALNGYFYDVIPYIGATGGSACLGLGEKIVLELTQPLFGRNRQIFCDNYFTTIPLFHTLLNYHTNACGTIRINTKKYIQRTYELIQKR